MVGVAQLVEPRIVIPVVVGSSPIVHPSFSKTYLPIPAFAAYKVGEMLGVPVKHFNNVNVGVLPC